MAYILLSWLEHSLGRAYDGYSDKGTRSVKGWIYGTIGTIFYLGNIYGSVVAVRIQNERLENDLLKRIEINVKWM